MSILPKHVLKDYFFTFLLAAAFIILYMPSGFADTLKGKSQSNAYILMVRPDGSATTVPSMMRRQGAPVSAQPPPPQIPSDMLADIHDEVTKQQSADSLSIQNIYAPSPHNRERIVAWGGPAMGTGGKPRQPGLSAWATEVENILPSGYHILQITSARDGACLLRSDHTVWCWGWAVWEHSNIPVKQIMGWPPIDSFYMGADAMCARDDKRKFWCWDTQEKNQGPFEFPWLKSNPENADLKKLTESFISLSPGMNSRCAITSSGSVWCWGPRYATDGNPYPELQKGYTIYPVPISLPHPAISVSSGFTFDCALLSDRSGWCWDPSLHPKPFSPLGPGTAVRQIWPGLVVTEDRGMVLRWYQPDKNKPLLPTPVKRRDGTVLEGIVKAVNAASQCGLDGNGHVWCWSGPRANPEEQPNADYAMIAKLPDGSTDMSHVIDISTNATAGVFAILDGEEAVGPAAEGDYSEQFMDAVIAKDFDKAIDIYKTHGAPKDTGATTEQAMGRAIISNRDDLLSIILDTGHPIGPGSSGRGNRLEWAADSVGAGMEGSAGSTSPTIIKLMLEHGADLTVTTATSFDMLEFLEEKYAKNPDAGPLMQTIAQIRKKYAGKPSPLPISVAREDMGRNKILLSASAKAPEAGPDCGGFQGNAKEILRRFPIVVEATLTDQHRLKLGKVFKGFRARSMEFPDGDVSGINAKAGSQLFILAGFDGNKAILDKCSKVFDESDVAGNTALQTLMVEASLYDSALRALQDSGASNPVASPPSRQSPAMQLYTNKISRIKDYNDYLYQLEFSLQRLKEAIKSLEAQFDYHNLSETARGMYVGNMMTSVRASEDLCLDDENPDSVFLPDDFKKEYYPVIVSNSDFDHQDHSEVWAAAADLASALMQLRQYKPALYIMCKTYAPGLYFSAVNALGHPELVNGRKFGRAGDVTGGDLSGLVLKGLDAVGAHWINVNLDRTDLTNGHFDAADLSNVVLDSAKLDLATYDCHTVFPKGFDPVAHHMIKSSRWGCESSPASKADISNVHVASFYNGAPDRTNHSIFEENAGYDYDEIVFSDLNIPEIAAQQSVLGALKCTNCKIAKANFDKATVALKLEKSTLSDASFAGADLRGSSMSSVSLESVNFNGANLSGVNFSGSDNVSFHDVDFSGTDLSGAILFGARYDRATKWPPGFDPKKAGLTPAEP